MAAVLFLQGSFALPLAASVVVIEPGNGPPAGIVPARLLPEKPAMRVAEQTGDVAPDVVEELEEELASAALQGIDMYTLILREAPVTEPYQLGTELIRRWPSPRAPIRALVLSIPPVTPEPYLFIHAEDAERVGSELFTRLGEAALESSAQRPTAAVRAVVASTELAVGLITAKERIDDAKVLEEMRKPTASAATPLAVAPDPAPPAPENPDPSSFPFSKGKATGVASETSRLSLLVKKLDWETIRLPVYIAGGILAAALAILVAVIRKRMRPRLFPMVAHRRRFSAPFSGGNNARVVLSRSKAKLYDAHG